MSLVLATKGLCAQNRDTYTLATFGIGYRYGDQVPVEDYIPYFITPYDNGIHQIFQLPPERVIRDLSLSNLGLEITDRARKVIYPAETSNLYAIDHQFASQNLVVSATKNKPDLGGSVTIQALPRVSPLLSNKKSK